MIVSLSRVKKWTHFFVLFILFTLLLYQILNFLIPIWKAELMYSEPKGAGAVKVLVPYQISRYEAFRETFKERLLLFCLMGE